MIRRSRAVLVAALSTGSCWVVGGCGADSPSSHDGVETTGELDLHLDVGHGIVLGTVTYTITGPNGFSRTGTLDLSHSSTISGLLSGIPTGVGYTITLTGVAGNGTTCAGSATFDVSAHTTIPVVVHLTCHEVAGTGSAQVSGNLNLCPVIDGLSASPTEVLVGGSIALAGVAHDSDGGPAALSYQWTATSGSLSSASSPSPTFTCTTPGVVTLTLTVSDGDPAAGCAAVQTSNVTCSKTTTTLAVYGDWPYSQALFAAAPKLLASINNDPDVDLVLHVGDIHSGSMICSAAWNQSIFDLVQQFQDPFVYTPGDNEWTDCHKAKEFSSGYPPQELARIRELFFASPGSSLGLNPKHLLSQGVVFDPAFPTDAQFVENVMWEQSSVLFVTLNVPGSNNDTAPWTGTFSNPPAQADEVATRNAANIRWLDRAFAQAKADGDVALLLGLQADMWDPAALVAGSDGLNAYDGLVQELARLTVDFNKPVLLFNGDSHVFESDQPLADPTSATGVIHAVPYPVSNLTRITVEGSTLADEWVKLTVDPAAPQPFSWQRVVYLP